MKFHEIFSAKCYEPIKRNKDGLRYVGHRFPIRNGISLREVMVRSFVAKSIFLTDTSKNEARIGDTLRIKLPHA